MAKTTKKSTKKVTRTMEERMIAIEQYSFRGNGPCANNTNSKLGKAIISVSMPICVCSPEYPCYKDCYARKGHQSFDNVQGGYYRNFRLYNEDNDKFFEMLFYKIKSEGLSKVRYFDCGDFPDYNFLVKTVELAKLTPEITYLTYTKRYDYVNEFLEKGGKFPSNYLLYFSAWDKHWKFDNKFNLPIAYVDFKDKSRNPQLPSYGFNCPGKPINCSVCGACFNPKLKAVIFQQH